MSRPPKPVRYEKKPIYRKSARLEEPDQGSAQAVAARCSTRKPTLAGTFQQLKEFRHGQAHDVPEIAFDSLDERRSSPLDCVAPCAAFPLPDGYVALNVQRVELAEIDERGRHFGQLDRLGTLTGAAENQAAQHLVRPARELVEHVPRL